MKANSYQARNVLLQSLGYPSYRDYLDSPLWAEIKAKAIAIHGTSCRICSRPFKSLHHLGYGREVLLGLSLTQIVPLCGHCHYLVEFTSKGVKRSLTESHGKYCALLRRATRKREGQFDSNGKKVKVDPEKRKTWHGYCRVCGYRARKGTMYCRPHSREIIDSLK